MPTDQQQQSLPLIVGFHRIASDNAIEMASPVATVTIVFPPDMTDRALQRSIIQRVNRRLNDGHHRYVLIPSNQGSAFPVTDAANPERLSF